MRTSRTPEGQVGLNALVDDPARGLVTLDYDGVLAPIVARPEDARPAPGALDAVTACAAVFGTVAIVTGRPAEVVVALGGLATVEGLVVLGHYGEERWTRPRGVVAPPEHPGVTKARLLLGDRLGAAPPGVLVEDKGLSLAIHTRGARDPEATLAGLVPAVTALAAETGLEVNSGRLVLELRPPGARDKGDAIGALVRERSPAALFFAGDDLVDLPAYAAVHAFRAAGGASAGLFVDNPEAAAVRDWADVVVPDTAAAVAFLRDLAAAAR